MNQNSRVQKLLCPPSASIREAMAVIDAGAMAVAFIIDSEGKLAGLVTDGDVRRAILRGVNLDEPVSSIMNSSPLAVQSGWSAARKHDAIVGHRKNIANAPVIDSSGRVVGIALRSELAPGPSLPFSSSEPRKSEAVSRVLVVGGAGYIGSVLVRKLLSKGYKVRVLDNLYFGGDSLSELSGAPGFELVKGDIRNIERLMSAIVGCDAVIHLAAIVGDQASDLSPEATIEINYTATRLLAEIARHHQINRFLFASTCSVYGAGADETLSESSPLNPVSLYAKTKIQSEQGLLSLANGNFSPCILRLSTVYGLSPRMRFDLVVNLLTVRAAYEGKFTIFGGSQWRPFVNVSDVAEAFILALEAPLEKIKGEVFNVGSESENYQLSQVGEVIAGQFPQAAMEIKADSIDARNYRVLFDKIKSLGFVPKTTVPQGIAEMKAAMLGGNFSDYRDKRYSNYAALSDRELLEEAQA